MEYTAENLEKAVTLFYRSEAGQQAQAHQWLTEAQSCPQAWSFVWELLQPHRSSEVQFFAATTLHTKILRFWHEVPREQYEALKKQILDAILTYAMGPKIVLNRLCITLSAYILYTVPQHWPNAFNDLLTSFQPQHLPNIQPERVVWVLLEILTLIPEEFNSMNFTQAQRNIVRNELQVASKDVLKAIEMYMSSVMTNSFSAVDITTYLNAARCANAWFCFGGLTIEHCDNVITYLLEICSNCYWKCSSPDGLTSDETELIEATLEAVNTIIAHPNAHKYPTLVTMQFDKVMNKLVKILHAEREKSDADMNVQVPIYTLIITCAETHSKLLIQNLLKKDSREYELSLWIIHTILMCTDTAGANPVDEECSNLSFGFWYLLQDEVLNLDNEISQGVVQIVKPFYRDLISILLRKSMLPKNDDDPKWTSESKEILRCHRQDIADTMMYSYEILDVDLLNILNQKLHEALQLCTDNDKVYSENWPHIEACLYAYFAIAEHFESEEEYHLPRLMEILTKIPYEKLHVKVLATALDIVGAYANWINEHPFVLNNVIPLLMLGLQNTDVGTSSTMALKDITRECQVHIRPFAIQILQTAQSALQNRVLRVAENIRLMYSVGKVLSVLPMENIMEYLNLILSPIIEEFQKLLLTEQFNNATRSMIIIKLRMFSMLFSTLDTNVKEIKKEPTNYPQPTLLVLQKVMPLFSQLAGKLCEDAEVMEVLYSALKHGITTLSDDSKPIVNDILQILVSSYRIKPLSSALELSKHLMLMFGKDPEYSQTMHLLLCEIVNVTLQLTANKSLSDTADVLEAFFAFLTQLFKKCPDMLCQDGVNIVALFQCAILCLGVPELPTVKAAASFITKFISQSRESDPLVNTIHNGGETLVVKVMLCIGGESPRSGLDPFSDILLALNKKYCDFLARWFAVIIAQEGFPSRLVTQAQKEHFVKAVLKEKANKRKMQDIVKEFSLLCRGLVGTEYGSHNLYL